MDFTQPQSPQPMYGAPMPGPAADQPAPPKLKGRKKDKPEKQVTKKVVNKNLKFAVGFALAAAGVVALTLGGSKSPDLYVVRAVDTVNAGTAISSTDGFEAVPASNDQAVKGAYTGTSKSAALASLREDIGDGTRVQYPIEARAQVTKNDFSVDLILDEPLKSDERLMSISATVANAVAGKIRAGDKVDIAATDGDVSSVVFTGVEIVAVTVSENQYQSVADQQKGEAKNTSPDELLPGDPVPGIYTVRVKDSDVVKLHALASQADLSLIYAPKDASATPLGAETARDIMCATASSPVKGC